MSVFIPDYFKLPHGQIGIHLNASKPTVTPWFRTKEKSACGSATQLEDWVRAPLELAVHTIWGFISAISGHAVPDIGNNKEPGWLWLIPLSIRDPFPYTLSVWLASVETSLKHMSVTYIISFVFLEFRLLQVGIKIRKYVWLHLAERHPEETHEMMSKCDRLGLRWKAMKGECFFSTVDIWPSHVWQAATSSHYFLLPHFACCSDTNTNLPFMTGK